MFTLPIKKFRRMRHLTLEQLSELSGISASQLSRLEADNIIRNRSTTLSTLEKIAISLKICGKDLIYYDCSTCQLRDDCPKTDIVDYEDVLEKNLEFYI